jgi:hypothetical protein
MPQLAIEYMRQCNEQARKMTGLFRASTIDALILTPRYWAIVPLNPHLDHARSMVDFELAECERRLGETIDEVKTWRKSWSKPGVLIIADTNVFLHHLEPFDRIDWRSELDRRDMDDLTLVIPLIVIDELDNLKRSGAKEVRPRARGALKLIDGFVATGKDRSTIAVPTISHGGVYVRLLVDPPRHVRLPHADSELIDRAASLIDLVSRTSNPVIFVTGDTGAVIRARTANVDVIKLQLDN